MKYIFDFIIGISWPVVALIIAVILRKPLSALFDKIQLVKYGPFELRLAKSINKTVKEVVTLSLDKKIKKQYQNIPKLFNEKCAEIAKVAPIGVIFYAYEQVENTIAHEYVTQHGMLERDKIDETVEGIKDAMGETQYKLFKEIQRIHDKILVNRITNIHKKTCLKYGKVAGILVALFCEFWIPVI